VNQKVKKIKLSSIRFREDLYPRIKTDPVVVQQYADILDNLEPIEVNQNHELIDGWYRWKAYETAGRKEIPVVVTPTSSDTELMALAIQRNARNAVQLSREEKQRAAVRLYATKEYSKTDIVKLLAVSIRSVERWVAKQDQIRREERQRIIQDLYLGCNTTEEIGKVVGLSKTQVAEEIKKLCSDSAKWRKANKVTFSEDNWQPPLYNVWRFNKKTNAVDHFGGSEQRIPENLLYLYTEPLDIVLDPFAGGGSTIDVCKKRMRRYWASDRVPKTGREHEIRKLDICQELPPLNNRWREVSLTYLDPPYWRQAEGKYSSDPEDLANMSLEDFTNNVANVVKKIASKQSKGVIAMLMQPTQWKAENRQFTDHVFDIISAVGNKKVRVENRVSCPYSIKSCEAPMVEWAKENKQLLVVTRELVIWRIL